MAALITVTDLTTELGDSVSVDNQSTHLQVIVDGVLALWNSLTGKVWGQASYEEFHSCQPGTDRIFLGNTPVIDIGGIYDDSDWVFGENTLISSNDYNFNPENGTIYCEIGFDTGFRNVKVEYDAGYTAATLPRDIKMVLLRQMAHWFKKGKDFPGYEKSASSRVTLMESLLPEFKVLADVYGKFI